MKTTIDILLHNLHLTQHQQRIAPPTERWAWNKKIRRLLRDLKKARARSKEQDAEGHLVRLERTSTQANS
jgi:hypothetical protein